MVLYTIKYVRCEEFSDMGADYLNGRLINL